MKTPTLEEVKEYFKDAEKIQSIIGRKFKNDGKFRGSKYAMDGDTSIYAKNGKYEVWNQLKGYSKILSYKKPKEETKTYVIKQESGMDSITINGIKYIPEPKEETFLISRSQLEQLHRQGNDYTKFDLEYLFPPVFKEEKKEFVVGKWYKDESDPDFKYLFLYKGKGNACGFFNGKWEESLFFNICENRLATAIEATEQEVTEVLTKEAVRKGYNTDKPTHFNYKNGTGYLQNPSKSDFLFRDGILYLWDIKIFEDGQWAEIIPTITKQEAEAKLKELGVNAKIV